MVGLSTETQGIETEANPFHIHSPDFTSPILDLPTILLAKHPDKCQSECFF